MMRGTIRMGVASASAALGLAVIGLFLPWRGAMPAAASASITLSLLEGRQAPGAAEAEPPPAPPPREQRRPSGNPLWAVPMRALSATRDRPLFSPSRRPPAPAVAAAPVVVEAPAPRPAAPERPMLTLVGTIIGEGDKIAIFFNPSSNTVIRLRLGQSEGGWVLRSVGSRETVLEKDHQSFTLALPAPEDVAPTGLPPGTEEQL